MCCFAIAGLENRFLLYFHVFSLFLHDIRFPTARTVYVFFLLLFSVFLTHADSHTLEFIYIVKSLFFLALFNLALALLSCWLFTLYFDCLTLSFIYFVMGHIRNCRIAAIRLALDCILYIYRSVGLWMCIEVLFYTSFASLCLNVIVKRSFREFCSETDTKQAINGYENK